VDVAAAKKDGKVVVYGSVVPQAMEELHKTFEKKYEIKVEYWRGSSTAVAERAQSEWRAGRPAFDVVESSWDVMTSMKIEGLFGRYLPPSAEKFSEQFKDKDGLITPWRILPISILYNTELVQAGETPKKSRGSPESQMEGKNQHSRSVPTHDHGEIFLELGETHGIQMARIRESVGQATTAVGRIPRAGNASDH
jgi:iron(III) transport system substrate-binding protein